MSFNLTKDYYDVSEEAGFEHPDGAYRVYLDRDPYQAAIQSADFGGDGFVIFDGHGVPDSGGSVVVAVGAKQRQVTLAGGPGANMTPKIEKVE